MNKKQYQKQRDVFEKIVESYTGRDIEYHKRNLTTGLDFAWVCFQAGVNWQSNNTDEE